MGGYNSLPVQSGRNPYLDEIDAAANNAHAQLSPGAQMALRKAGAPVDMTGGASATPQITNPRPAPPAIGQPPMSENLPNGQPAMLAGTGIHMPTRQQPQAVPPTAAEGPIRGELQRLTAPPPTDPNLIHTHENTGTAGVNQIHNPWARIPLQILGGIGETFAPRLAAALPGTESHHQMLVGEAEGALKQQQGIREAEEKAQRGAADVGHLGAEAANLEEKTNELDPAQAREADARAWSLLNPADKEKELTEFALWHKQNPDAPVGDWIKLKAGEGKGPTNAFELWHKQNPDKPAEEWLKIEAGNKPETMNEYADFKRGYLAKHPNASGDEVVRAYAAGHQAPERPPQALMVVPGENGAPGRAVNVTAGSSVPAGAITPSGISSETVAANKTAETERKAREELAKEYQVSVQLAANPSATNDVALLMRFIGSTKPDSLGKLRLNQQEMNLVMGTRGTLGDLEALAQKVQNGQALTPRQRTDMLNTMALLAGQPAPGGASGAVPNVGENFQGGKVLKVTKIK